MNDAVVCAHSSGPSVVFEASSIVARGVSRFRVFVFAGRESFASSRSTQLHFVGAAVSFLGRVRIVVVYEPPLLAPTARAASRRRPRRCRRIIRRAWRRA